jgi:hypothetical protein
MERNRKRRRGRGNMMFPENMTGKTHHHHHHEMKRTMRPPK